jgi:hypothetical protein
MQNVTSRRILLAVLACVAGLAPQLASADPIHLTCNERNGSTRFYVTIDLDAQTAMVTMDPSSPNAYSPLTEVSDDSLKWTWDVPGGGPDAFSLDRNSGTLEQVTPNQGLHSFACVKSQRIL